VIEDIKSVLNSWDFEGVPYAFDAVGNPSGVGSAQMVASCASHDAILVSVVVQKDRRFRMPLAVTDEDVTLRIPGVPHPITIPARKEDHQRALLLFNGQLKTTDLVFDLSRSMYSKGEQRMHSRS
jgi:hypothetical protein